MIPLGPADGDEQDPFKLTAALAVARQGIPQGSAVSSQVAEMVLALSLNAVPRLGIGVRLCGQYLTLGDD